jgi:SAM-dependent methyltransferase
MTESTIPSPIDPVVERVHDRYAATARALLAQQDIPADVAGTCCGPDGSPTWGNLLYSDADRAALPDAAVLASLGCGNPTAVADLRAGDTVLDLGSGGGIDVILSAQRVGPTGYAFGLDMTDEMLQLARQNASAAGIENVEFVKGRMEAMPIADDTIDVVISNCVVNLSADKATVLAEIARVLKPGGRVGISDVVADDDLTPEERATRGSFVGCIAGALSFAEYDRGLAAVGLVDATVTPTHAIADGLYGAIVQATKPMDWSPERVRPVDLPRPVEALTVLGDADAGGCCGGAGCC